MKTIYKYKLHIQEHQSIEIPNSAKFLYLGIDPIGDPCLWAEVESENKTEVKLITIVGTGSKIPNDIGNYFSSFIHNSFVWHIYIKSTTLS